MLNGRLIHGAHGNAGHIGHIIVRARSTLRLRRSGLRGGDCLGHFPCAPGAPIGGSSRRHLTENLTAADRQHAPRRANPSFSVAISGRGGSSRGGHCQCRRADRPGSRRDRRRACLGRPICSGRLCARLWTATRGWTSRATWTCESRIARVRQPGRWRLLSSSVITRLASARARGRCGGSDHRVGADLEGPLDTFEEDTDFQRVE